jgi:hypothetical protein
MLFRNVPKWGTSLFFLVSDHRGGNYGYQYREDVPDSREGAGEHAQGVEEGDDQGEEGPVYLQGPSACAAQSIRFRRGELADTLAERPNDDCIPPMNLEKMGSEIEQFLAENHNGIICLNGMEVLEMWNGLASVVTMLRKAQRSVRITDNTIVVSLDPKKLFWNDISSLKRISDDVVMCTG